MTIELRHEPVQRRSKLRLEQLEAAARQVLAEDGRDRLTTGRIAEVAGCSIGTVYRYFPDRVAALDLIAPDRDAPVVKPVAPTEWAVRSVVGAVLTNASNYPAAVRPRILGRDMSPLIDAMTNRLLASDLFESRAQVQAEVIAALKRADIAPLHVTDWLDQHFGLEAGR